MLLLSNMETIQTTSNVGAICVHRTRVAIAVAAASLAAICRGIVTLMVFLRPICATTGLDARSAERVFTHWSQHGAETMQGGHFP
jgi:hypothetical protein